MMAPVPSATARHFRRSGIDDGDLIREGARPPRRIDVEHTIGAPAKGLQSLRRRDCRTGKFRLTRDPAPLLGAMLCCDPLDRLCLAPRTRQRR